MYYVFYGKALLMKSNNIDHIMQTIFPFILNEKVKCNIYLLCFDYDDYYDLDKYIDFYDPNHNYICYHHSGEFELNDISLFKIDFYDPNHNYICFHNSEEFELNDISLFKKISI